ncbi:MAG: 2-amino-4-hydroxy-6-hydroxymethyldihydropteridine diphosphokinase [Neisseria sp.]|nr:2-amino-4-hydroxy-6-hydroxymethyldihydropteridine diphosphokinase [Neisseria sp.]
MKIAVIALGSNLDGPEHHLQAACNDLSKLPESHVLKISSFYRSAPVGYADQPDFVNAVLILHTALPPHELLRHLQQIENAHGRVRSFTNAPRTLDLDIIDYQGETSNDPLLTLPHPRAHERAFVMQPLAEIAPDYLLRGRRVAAIAAELDDSGITRLSTHCHPWENT